MRMTITLDPDVAAAVVRLRAESRSGLSSVVNDLIRRGLKAGDRPRFVQETSPMGARQDVTDVTGLLEALDGPEHARALADLGGSDPTA